jgi:hypothetical protein
MRNANSNFSVRILLRIKLLLLILCNLSGAFAQPSSNPAKKFEDYSLDNLQEKVYAHLDRTDHITGEILWFKIYCVDGRQHKPLDISKIVYAEILNSENTPVLQTKLSLESGEGSGSLFIPATLPSGNYLFRAYTNWMKNGGPEYFFQKKISIVNTLKANEAPGMRITTEQLDAQFFPEGGYLIESVPARVGFKVINSKGTSVNCRGALINQSNDTIVRFKSTKFGIGSFEFTPQSNQTYKAVLLHSKRQSTSFNFPTAIKSGYSLMVKEAPEEKLRIAVTNPDGNFTTQLFIHTRQSIKISEVKTTSGKTLEFSVEKKKLGDGVSHITIFDERGVARCERLYFKKPTEKLELSSTVDQKEYSIRRKVQLAIQSAQSQSGSLSVSVFRGDSLSTEENIKNYLLLTSDLTGPVESPEYYFSEEPQAAEAVENLMLTQGWRRFKWESVLSQNKPIIKHLPEIKGHLVQGKILDANNQPMSGKVGYLASPGKKIRLYVSKSDSAGRVRFQLKDFQETGKVIAQTNYELDSLCHIEIEKPFSTEYPNWLANDLLLDLSIEDELLDRSIGMQVQEAYYEDETYFRFKKMDTDSIPFYGEADEEYSLDDYTRFPVMEEVMREYVKGVWVRKRKDQFRFMVLDKGKENKPGIFHDNPLTLLDGVPVFNIDKVLEIDPLKVEKIEVMTRKYFLGPLVLSGIVSLSTYNGDLGGVELDPRSVSLDYEGLQSQREFYSPRYTSAALRGSTLPDQRHQLYWNVSIKLTGGKTSPIEFYTSDVEGNFYVVVEGLSSKGLPGFTFTSFEVSP